MNRRLRVMLADDHETIRQGLRALFESVPEIEVVHDVADGDAALAAIRTIAPDLVVIDLSMLPTDGLTVMRRIKDARRQTSFVVLTRYREAGYVREALAVGASGYVLKQSPFSVLREAVEAVGRGEQFLDPGLGDGASPGASPSPQEAEARVSPREYEVVRRAAMGQPNKEIGDLLGIAVKTVEMHKARAMKKLGLCDRTQLIRYASLQGWLRDA